jgi:NDP-sugar pyrophosphorylase family protein
MLNLVVAMAGAGSRFREAGYDLPKPLIPAFGEPMYRHAVRSLPLHLAERLIFLIRHDRWAAVLRRDIESTFGSSQPRIVEIDHATRGQAETVLFAKEHLNPLLPMLIHNADSAFEVPAYGAFPSRADGALFLFRGTGPQWSYAALGPSGIVTLVKEKDPISDFASTGTYYFRSSTELFELIDQAMQQQDTVNGEYYLGPLYNRMIARGRIILGYEVERFISFGTPQELEAAEADPANQAMINRLARQKGITDEGLAV